MTIYERAIELVPNDSIIGLGSGRAAWAFVGLLGERVRSGQISVRGVACSAETTLLAAKQDVPLIELEQAGELAVTFDGADEVDTELNLIKGYGRALVREKVVAASSRSLVILVGEEKLVPKVGSRGKLPVEVVPFAVSLVRRKLVEFGLNPVLWESNGQPGVTDNGNLILDCGCDGIDDPNLLESNIRAIPGVVGTGLFLGMADRVLVGGNEDFHLKHELCRQPT